MGASYARDIFYEALETIGITESIRKERHLILYGARHYFNNTMRFILSSEELRDWLGHADTRMTHNYSQATKDKATEIGIKISKAISLPEIKEEEEKNGQ